MSHPSERKEKICLNCEAVIIGRYCHVCGQENAEPKETVWQLVSHFFSDITHFDGKFFTSLKYLMLKPGFLSKQYMSGKRAGYLNPIRMYLFTSFIFFLIFFSAFKLDNVVVIKAGNNNTTKEDSAQLIELSPQLNNGKPITDKQFKKRLDTARITFIDGNYKSKEEYDSLLKTGARKDNWYKRMITYKGIELKNKYKNNNGLAVTNILGILQHSIPKMLFILLPLFALLLKLLNLRHKDFYYTDHAIFTIHFYIFVFLAMLLIFGISKLETVTGASWLVYLEFALVLTILFYLYKAMRNFYRQGRGRTILKFSVLLIAFSCIGIFITSVFFFISIFEI